MERVRRTRETYCSAIEVIRIVTKKCQFLAKLTKVRRDYITKEKRQEKEKEKAA